MILTTLQQTLLVTGLVMSMMMLIEFVNTSTHGMWMTRIGRSSIGQVGLATLLGVIPGCFGTFTVVSLYTHKLLGFGALVAGLIATSGDEAFMMLAMIPEDALIVILGVGIVGFLTGLIVDKCHKTSVTPIDNKQGYAFHAVDHASKQGTTLSFKHITFDWQRVVSVAIFVFFLIAPFVGLVVHEHECIHGIAEGHHHHHHEHGFDWIGALFSFFAGCSALICLLSSEHFVKEHVWNHVIRKHFLKILLWTFGVLLLVIALREHTDVNAWVSDNVWIVLLVAVAVGIIPQSGPHLLFLSLYINGAIPLGILIANSIVQDGHGALPLLAESKRGFVWAKMINILVGLLVGAIMLIMNR